MMHRYLLSFACLIFLTLSIETLGASSRGRLSSPQMFQTNALLIKFKNQLSPTLRADGALNVGRSEIQIRTTVPYHFEPTFHNPTRIQPPVSHSRRARSKPSRFENFYYSLFSRKLKPSEAAQVLKQVQAHPAVEYAHFEPVLEEAIYEVPVPGKLLRRSQVPNFEANQFYLDPAPRGVDARQAWTLRGGDGKGIRVMDFETGWFTEHREFFPPFFDNGKNQRRDHGTAVWGVISAKNDGVGVTGIAFSSDFAIAGTGYKGEENYPDLVTRSLGEAVTQLDAGDILVIEQHSPGPDNSKYTAIEYWPGIFEVLKATTDRGVHCIAAAGNGDSNFDSPAYQGAFDLKVRDSGCVIVGAGGAADTGGHLTRLSFSNYGSRVDAFGYGELVTTTGYGDLHMGGTAANYTRRFNGTSSATPIVAGAAASLLGIAKAQGVSISPEELRAALRATGTPQKNPETGRIGNLPDLKQLISEFRQARRRRF